MAQVSLRLAGSPAPDEGVVSGALFSWWAAGVSPPPMSRRRGVWHPGVKGPLAGRAPGGQRRWPRRLGRSGSLRRGYLREDECEGWAVGDLRAQPCAPTRSACRSFPWGVARSGTARAGLVSARCDLKLSPRQFPGRSHLPPGVRTGSRSGKRSGGAFEVRAGGVPRIEHCNSKSSACRSFPGT